MHDLRNPHTWTAPHDAQLDVLVPAADALVTLTPGAAREIWRALGSEHTSYPTRTSSTSRHDGSLTSADRQAPVGVHVKSLRASMDPGRLLPDVGVVSTSPGTVLQVNAHRDVLERAAPGTARRSTAAA